MRYIVKRLTQDCWLVVDSWSGDDVYTTRTEHEAESWCKYYEANHHDKPTDIEFARAELTPDEFEQWLLNGGGE